MNPIIEQLPPGVVNKIAAGEVIERPASVVKELVENSIDAGATRIDVALKKGGSELIRVADTGCGIAAEQLTLAVTSHATSKIRSADDLFSVSTLGFRGEALASIAEVSQFTLTSRTHDAAEGGRLEVQGGAHAPRVPCGGPAGTTIEVANLFYNTPVRRKFLRTTQTELGHCLEALTRLALANTEVHFSISHNDRQLYDLAPTPTCVARIARLFGEHLAESLIEVSADEGPVRLSGYAANPSHSRANNRQQYLYLNGRFIRDRSLQHALTEAYRGLLLSGRYPICFLFIETAADDVDVNVHPTKLEVRFRDAGSIYSLLLGTLRTRFLSTDLTARLQPTGGSSADISAGISAGDDRSRDGMAAGLGGVVGGGLGEAPSPGGAGVGAIDSLAGPLVDGQALPEAAVTRAAGRPEQGEVFQAWRSGPAVEDGSSNGGGTEPPWQGAATADGPLPEPAPEGPRAAVPVDAAVGLPTDVRALQVHDRYLIAESDEGLVVIDQHALHERILYEELREKLARGALESQSLLVPEPVDLTAAERAAVMDNRELLGQLGVSIEPFGGETVLVSRYPAMLANLPPAQLLRQLVDHLLAGGKAPDRRDVLDELMQLVACKAAIKAGDRLTPQEVSCLVEQRHLARDGHHCPHGRPTALVFTRQQLDRQFKRI